MNAFVSTWLANCSRYAPDSLAFKYGDREIAWREMDRRTNRLANGLWELGIRKGDRVILMFHNCIEFVETTYAIQKIGAIPVPINYRFVPREIIYQTTNSESVAYIFEDVWMDAVLGARPELPDIENWVCFRRNGEPLPEGMHDYETLMERFSPDTPPPVDMDWTDTAVIIYTGGTTGFPKGVMLSYGNHRVLFSTQFGSVPAFLGDLKLPLELVDKVGKASPIPKMDVILRGLVRGIESKAALRVFNNKRFQRVTSSGMRKVLARLLGSKFLARLGGRITARHRITVLWTSFQMFHDAYFPLLLLSPMSVIFGAMIMPDTISFDPAKTMAMLDAERPWLFGNTPTGWKMICSHLEEVEPGSYDTASVGILGTGGGVNPASLKERMLRHFHQAIIWDMFGQTEMTPVTSFRFDTARMERKDRSVGKPIVETRIVDEDGNEVEPGEVGEIIYKGQTIMQGYYGDAEKTAAAMRDGWFHSGDLGYIDDDGDIRVLERKSECINTGAEKVFPSEVEDILEMHPLVVRACVIGVPDEKWGHAVRAVLQLKEGASATEEEILEWTRDQMVGFKRPKSVVFVDDLPVTPVGKVMRKAVTEAYGKADKPA